MEQEAVDLGGLNVAADGEGHYEAGMKGTWVVR